MDDTTCCFWCIVFVFTISFVAMIPISIWISIDLEDIDDCDVWDDHLVLSGFSDFGTDLFQTWYFPVCCFVLSAICGFTCEALQELAPGPVLIASVYTVLAYPAMWSLQSDLEEYNYMLQSCDEYSKLITATTVGTVFGVLFFVSWCAFPFGMCCDFCECFDERIRRCQKRIVDSHKRREDRANDYELL